MSSLGREFCLTLCVRVSASRIMWCSVLTVLWRLPSSTALNKFLVPIWWLRSHVSDWRITRCSSRLWMSNSTRKRTRELSWVLAKNAVIRRLLPRINLLCHFKTVCDVYLVVTVIIWGCTKCQHSALCFAHFCNIPHITGPLRLFGPTSLSIWVPFITIRWCQALCLFCCFPCILE